METTASNAFSPHQPHNWMRDTITNNKMKNVPRVVHAYGYGADCVYILLYNACRFILSTDFPFARYSFSERERTITTIQTKASINMELKKQQWCQSIHRCEHNVLLVNNIYFPDKIARVRARASRKTRRIGITRTSGLSVSVRVYVWVCASDVMAYMENCPMFSFHYEARHWYYN